MDIINLSDTGQLINLFVFSVVISVVINDLKNTIKVLMFSRLGPKNKYYKALMPYVAVAVAYLFTYSFNTQIFLGSISELDRFLVATFVSKGGNWVRKFLEQLVAGVRVVQEVQAIKTVSNNPGSIVAQVESKGGGTL